MSNTTPIGTTPVRLDEDRRAFRVVVVASSTGGPAALATVIGGLGDDFDLPVLVVQHMMPAFNSEFSNWLGRNVSLPVEVATHGRKMLGGRVYLAPENLHMKIIDRRTVGVSDEPVCGYHRPSANVLFHSAAEHFGARTLAVVLTGMGNDGVEGLHSIHDAGGRVLVQDEESCVVFGMPGAAVAEGVADNIIALADMATRIRVLARTRLVGAVAESGVTATRERSNRS